MVIQEFQGMMERSRQHFDNNCSLTINTFASYYHAVAANELANIIFTNIQQVSGSKRQPISF